MSKRSRATSACAVALAALAGSILWAVPAEACMCGPRGQEGLDTALAAGSAIAIVTRTDSGGKPSSDTEPPPATFRVEDSVGPAVPATLEGSVNGSTTCQAQVAPGAIAALIVERKDGAWSLLQCGEIELGLALQRAHGTPVAASGGPAVAYAAGGYGGSRLAALDSAGRAVAWDTTAGTGELVAACPGGKTVVVAGHAPRAGRAQPRAELTVHDAATLRVLRTVVLEPKGALLGLAVRCEDERAELVHVLVSRASNDEGDTLTLTTVRGRTIETASVGRGAYAEPVEAGFVVLETAASEAPSLALVRPDGQRTTLAQLDDLDEVYVLAASSDGRTIAVSGRDGDSGAVVTVDGLTGERLGRFAPGVLYASGLAWTASGDLLVRRDEPQGESPVRVFDRKLVERHDQWPSVHGSYAATFGAVGDAAVVYGYGVRPTVTAQQGELLVADSFRLAAAEHLIALPDKSFGSKTATTEPSEDTAHGSAPSVGLLTALGVGAAVAGVVAARLVGNRRNRA